MPKREIIDLFYQSAFEQEKWPLALSTLGATLETDHWAIFYRSSSGDMRLTAASATRAIYQQMLDSGWTWRDERLEALQQHKLSGFVSDLDLFDLSTVQSSSFYLSQLIALGLGWSIFARIALPNNGQAFVCFDFPTRSGPVAKAKVEWLNRHFCDLSRALRLIASAQRLAAEQTLYGLSVAGIAACIVNRDRKIIATNPLMQRLIPTHIVLRKDGLALYDEKKDEILQYRLLQFADGDMQDKGKAESIAVRSLNGSHGYVLHVVPFLAKPDDLFQEASWVLAFNELDRHGVPERRTLKDLFHLTAAEAKIAQLAAGGMAPKDIGTHAGIAQNTAKVHLKAIYAKMGVVHHGALVKLLAATVFPLNAD